MTRLVHPPIWSCDPNYLTCRMGHLRKHHTDGIALDLSRVTGFVYHQCQQCSPPTYAFGIISVCAGETWVAMYAISREQFLARPAGNADEVGPVAMLAQLGYGPEHRRAA